MLWMVEKYRIIDADCITLKPTEETSLCPQQWCSPPGQALASRRPMAKFLGFGLRIYGFGLEGTGLDSCTDNVLVSPQTHARS